MDFNLEQLRELLKILNETDITELTLESGDLKLSVRKSDNPIVANPVAVGVPVSPAPQPIEPTGGIVPDNRKLVDIVSPMVGTFYRSPAPDEPPFVELGETIKRGQTVCIVEAMKLMNEIESETAGKVAEILVENGQPIEFGQVLMRIEV